MKTSLVRLKRQPVHKSEKCCPSGCTSNDSEEEPPGIYGSSDDIEEEPPSRPSTFGDMEVDPPGKVATTRYRFFRDIPDSVWNDWKWHLRNRITRIEQLAQFIPVSAEEQAQLKLVTMRYPLSVTPYYLSLINADDPDDPIGKHILAQTEGELVLRNYEERVFRYRNPATLARSAPPAEALRPSGSATSAPISRTSRSAGLGGTSRCE